MRLGHRGNPHLNMWPCSPKPRVDPILSPAEGVLPALGYSRDTPFSPYRTRAITFPSSSTTLSPVGGAGLKHFCSNPTLVLSPTLFFAPTRPATRLTPQKMAPTLHSVLQPASHRDQGTTGIKEG